MAAGGCCQEPGSILLVEYNKSLERAFYLDVKLLKIPIISPVSPVDFQKLASH